MPRKEVLSMKVVQITFYINNFKVVEFNIDGIISGVEDKFRATILYNNIEVDDDNTFSTRKNPLDVVIAALRTTLFDTIETTGDAQSNIFHSMQQFIDGIDISNSDLQCVVSLQEVSD